MGGAIVHLSYVRMPRAYSLRASFALRQLDKSNGKESKVFFEDILRLIAVAYKQRTRIDAVLGFSQTRLD